MYSAQGQFEGSLNSIGQRQSDLIKPMAMSIEWTSFTKGEEGSRPKQPLVQILEFSPSTSGYKFELVNLHPFHRHERRRK